MNLNNHTHKTSDHKLKSIPSMNAIGGFFCCMHAVVDVLNERARAGFDTHKVEVVTHYGPTGWAEGKATAAGIDRKRPRGHQTRRPRFQGSTQSINIEWIGPLNPPDARPFSQEAKPADRPAMRPPRVRDDRRAGTPVAAAAVVHAGRQDTNATESNSFFHATKPFTNRNTGTMPTLGDAYMGALRRKSVEKAP